MLGQPLKTLSTDAGNRVMLASVLGEPIRAWNDRGFITRAVYDAARRPTQQWVKPGVGSEQLVTFNVYGEQVADPEDSNLRGQLYRSYDSAGALTAELFDFKGNLLRQNRRVVEDYTTTPDWADLADEVTLGAIEAAAAALLESESFTTETTYDALGRVKTQTTPDDSETEHVYDQGGRLQAVQSKLRGAGSATEFIEQVEYDAKGQRQRVEFANETTTAYTYDPRTLRVTRIKTDRGGINAATMQDLKYTYDPAGNIVEIRDDAQETVYFSNAVVNPRQRYEYDAVYRLIWAEGRETPNGQSGQTELVPSPSPPPNDASAVVAYIEEYTYDEVGNILRMQHTATGNSWTRYYQYASDSNRLEATSLPGDAAEGPYTGTYTHDEHGNMTTMPHLSDGITWDYADRMQATHHGDGGTTYYVYDGAGQRVRKIRLNAAETTSKERLYFGAWELYREKHNINTTPVIDLERETLHVYDDAARICLIETKTAEDDVPIVDPANIARYQYSNHLGSATLELDDDAEVISYEEFHPFGTSSYSAANSIIEVSPKRYRYTGQERDEETGLAYHGARYYPCWLARWISPDPLGLADGNGRFNFCRDNPTTWRDPGGTSAIEGLAALGKMLDQAALYHPVAAQLKDVKDTVVRVVADLRTMEGGINKAIAVQNQSSESYSEEYRKKGKKLEKYKAKEAERTQTQLDFESKGLESITFYPGPSLFAPEEDVGLDTAETTLKPVAEHRIAAKWTDRAFPAATFADVIGGVEIVFPEGDPISEGAVREIVITGHGVTQRSADGTKAGILFGRTWENADSLGRQSSGLLSHALIPGATVDIQGCDVAATDRDKSFRWELGRVLFGEGSWGYIKSNRGEVSGQYTGLSETSLKGSDPEILVWPRDFPQHTEQSGGRATP